MKKLLVLLVLVSAGFALAENVTLWSCDFEEGEGFTEGKLAGQNGWAKLASWANDSVYVEKGSAFSGEQCASCEPNKGVNVQNNNIDISEEYVSGSTLMMSVYAKAAFEGTEPMSLRFHCLGTSGQQHSVEIAEINVYQDGTAGIWVNGGSLSVSGLVQGEYYKYGVIFEPDQKKIKKIFIGDAEKEGDNLYYKSIDTVGCGSLPDGFRFYNGGGCADDIKIDVVPEPAFFGLLAIAGLFFVRKQR
jgi:hypothetical protein